MYTEECWAGTYLYWTQVSITTGTNSAHLDVAALCRIYFVFVFTTRRRVVTLVRGADRRCVCGFLAWLTVNVDSLHGTEKGDGETDDDADATRVCGRGAGIVVVVVFVSEKSTMNEESRD